MGSVAPGLSCTIVFGLCAAACTGDSSFIASDASTLDAPDDNPAIYVDASSADVDASDAADAADAPSDSGLVCDASTAIVCSGICVNKETDPHNCNTCGHVCPGPDSGPGKGICLNATCQVSCDSDSGATLLCPSGCVDPTTITNCGGCGKGCTVPPSNGHATCSGSPLACGLACDPGYHGSGGTACNATCAPNTVDPSTDPCLVADGLGTFVSPAGSDTTGDGTKEKPFGSIGHAMDVAVGATKRVYACGTFTAEKLVVGSTRDGVSVYGGFSCSGWAYSASTKTKLSPAAAGYALEVDNAATGVTFEDFELDAVSAPSTPSATPASSIAVFANSAKLTLTRVAVSAGSGQPGAAGSSVSNWSGAAPGGSGPSSLVTGGAAGGPTSCVDGTSSQGGTGASVPGTATSGSPGGTNAGLSGTASCTVGGSGSPGAPDGVQHAGASSSGSTSSTGWTPAGPGSDGANGAVAQGGGGGGSNAGGSGGAGGGGGAGGCGGGKGLGGYTAGSSIGILAYQSSLVLSAMTIATQAGGAGGAGGPGQLGQAGGPGGPGGGSGNCVSGQGGGAGGPGGAGGGGGGGGGGAGGMSVGVAWKGSTPPTVDGTSVTQQATLAGVSLGPAGASGAGGSGSTTGASGVAGQAAAVMQSP